VSQRTTDWLQQPQPTSGIAGPSNVISLLEAEPAPTPKELKKQKRLAAFQDSPKVTKPESRLYPVEMGDKGRVLLDVTADASEEVKQLSPTRKRTSRRKNGVTAGGSSFRDRMPTAEQVVADRPNWPDSEFPWRLRLEERAGVAKAEEAERLRWIERFLDRDSDEEDENEEEIGTENNLSMPRPGRGKMVPLSTHSANPSTKARRNAFPSDPADARVALMSKRSVRALWYQKQQKASRKRNNGGDGDENDDEVICICGGRDGGLELVQCDGCQIWYHLRCIGIKSVAELGREEDPWYCDSCSRMGLTRTPSPGFAPSLSSEPTFVKTNDDEPTANASFDLPFFQPPLQYSPMTPWTTQSSVTHTHATRFGSGSSSDSPWSSSKHGPSTPQVLPHGIRPYTTTPSLFENFGDEDSPFDPTSTPSRGIRFGGPYATPKNSLWPLAGRTNRLFQTPSKQGRSTQLVGSLLLSSGEDHVGYPHLDAYRNLSAYDDSPIRRSKSGDEGSKTETALRSLGSPTSVGPLMSSLPASALSEEMAGYGANGDSNP
jgi:hypothetical protein